MIFDSVRQGFKKTVLFQLAFPHHYQVPVELVQLFFRFLVPVDITFELFPPEFDIRGWRRCPLASRVTMPETPANLNDRLVFRQNDVRMTRQIFDMQTEAKSIPEEKRAHHEFRSRVI